MRYSLAEIQDLEAQYKQLNSLHAEIDALNSLAWRQRFCQKDQAYRLAQKACALSRSGEYADQPYHEGLAAGLVTMAAIDWSWGKLDSSISQCAEALSILEGLPLIRTVADAWSVMCWYYYSLGDYSIAFEYALKTFKMARDLNARDCEARSLETIGCIYGISADYQNSLESHEESLRIFREIGDRDGEAVSYNNLACSLLDMGDYSEAIQAGLKSIELARQQELFEEELIISSTIADILVKMEEYEQAEEYLQKALEKALASHLDLLQVALLTSLSKLCLARGFFEQAEIYAVQALAIADQNDLKNEQMTCHQVLSDLCERAGQPAQALDHYKKFFALKEATTGSETARRIMVLKAAHQLEKTQREADTYHLQNIELQQEIEERKQVEAMLEELAIYDPLTNLLNRRQFTTLAKKELERSIRAQRPLSVLMLDLDHFKTVNDRYGHLIGDRVLVAVASIIKANLRESDIVGRYGGEEFVLLLPETSSKRAYEVGERLRQAIGERAYETTSGPFLVTISIGITQLRSEQEYQSDDLNELVFQADQALYAAKRAGRNRTNFYDPRYTR